MNKDTQQAKLNSILCHPNRRNVISEEDWVVSYMLKKDKSHAFFLLEGVKDGMRVIQVIELRRSVIGNGKATVSYRDIDFANFAELIPLCSNCVGFSQDFINPDHVGAFMDLVRAESVRAENGLISYDNSAQAFVDVVKAESARADYGLLNYIAMADSRCVGSVASCLEASGADTVLMSSRDEVRASQAENDAVLAKIPAGSSVRSTVHAKYLAAEFLSMLINYGHNSCTWSKAILQVMKIPADRKLYPVSINQALAKEYSNQSNDSSKEDASGCRIF